MELVKSKNEQETVTLPKLSYGFEEAAEVTGLGSAFLRNQARAGKLKTRKIGGRRLILTDDLMNYLKGETENV